MIIKVMIYLILAFSVWSIGAIACKYLQSCSSKTQGLLGINNASNFGDRHVYDILHWKFYEFNTYVSRPFTFS